MTVSPLYEGMNFADESVKNLLKTRRSQMPFASEEGVRDLRTIMEMIAVGDFPRILNSFMATKGYEVVFDEEKRIYKGTAKFRDIAAAFSELTDLVLESSKQAMVRGSSEQFGFLIFSDMQKFLSKEGGIKNIFNAIETFGAEQKTTSKMKTLSTALANMAYLAKKYGQSVSDDEGQPPPSGRIR